MATPIIHIAGGALIYLLLGDLSIDRIGIVLGVALLAVLPDFDFFLPGAHRGLSHSLVFCLLVALLVGKFTPFSYLSVFSILISHLILDSLADGVTLVSWLWPFKVFHSPVTYSLNDIPSFIKNCLKVF